MEREKEKRKSPCACGIEVCSKCVPLRGGRFFRWTEWERVGGEGYRKRGTGERDGERREAIQFMSRQCGFVSPNYHTWTYIHNPACTGALSYHSHALKYQVPPCLPPLPLVVSEAPMFMRSTKEIAGRLIDRTPRRREMRGFHKVIFDVRSAPTLPVRPAWRYAKFRVLHLKNWDTIFSKEPYDKCKIFLK